jgi:predicted glycosyltransferase
VEKLKIIFELGHPAHVHLHKNIMWELKRKNHNIKVVIREREQMVGPLLQKYNFTYENICPAANGITKKILTTFNNDLGLLKISKRFNPDMYVSSFSPYSSQVSAIRDKPHIGFCDTEDLPELQFKMINPFIDAILTPDCYLKKFPKKKTY